MLEDWIVLSKKVAARYARNNRSRAQDIYSAALEGLVVGYAELQTKEVPEEEVEIFLYSRIKFVIQDFISSDHMIPIPRRSRQRNELRYIEIEPLDEEFVGDTGVKDDFTIHDLPLESQEKAIVYMLDQGYTKNDIAIEMDTTRRAVYSSVDKIRVKVKEWCNAMQITY